MLITPDKPHWRYDIRIPEEMTWATFVFDEPGMWFMFSDYGHFAHGWYHHGTRDVREFFAGLVWRGEWRYILSKISREEVHKERTIAKIREELARQRRHPRRVCYYGKEERRCMTREEYEHEKRLLDAYDHGELDFNMWASHSQHLVVDFSEFAAEDYPEGHYRMARLFFPRLAEAIAAELRVERGNLPVGRKEGCVEDCGTHPSGHFHHAMACKAFCTHLDEEACWLCRGRMRAGGVQAA